MATYKALLKPGPLPLENRDPIPYGQTFLAGEGGYAALSGTDLIYLDNGDIELVSGDPGDPLIQVERLNIDPATTNVWPAGADPNADDPIVALNETITDAVFNTPTGSDKYAARWDDENERLVWDQTPIIDARAHGVVPGSSVDNTAALQSAFDAAEAAIAQVNLLGDTDAVATVQLPIGFIKTTGNTIASFTTVRGHGDMTQVQLSGANGGSNQNVLRNKNYGSATILDDRIQLLKFRILGNQANQSASSPQTFVTADTTVNQAPTSIPVLDTTGFSSTGRVWIGYMQITYTGKTSTTLTGCTIHSGTDTARKSSWVTPTNSTGHGVALQTLRSTVDVNVSDCYGSGVYLQGPDPLASGGLYGAENDLEKVVAAGNARYGVEIGPGVPDGVGGFWKLGQNNMKGPLLIRSGDWIVDKAHLIGTFGSTIPGPIPQGMLIAANYVKFNHVFFDTIPGTPVVLDCSIMGWGNVDGFHMGGCEFFLCSYMAGSAGQGVLFRGVQGHGNVRRAIFNGMNMWSPLGYAFCNGPNTRLVGTQDLAALPGNKLQVTSCMDFAPNSDIGGPLTTSTDTLTYTGRQMSQTKLTSPAAVGDTSITVQSTAGFDSSGKLTLLAFDGGVYTPMVISYTGKTATTFTGIPASSTGSITAAASSTGERGGVAQHFFTGVAGGTIASRPDGGSVYADEQSVSVTEMRVSNCAFRSFQQNRFNMGASDDWTMVNCSSGGKKMRSTGTLSVAAGTLTASAAHGLSETPTYKSIDPTADPQGRRYWVTANSTNITVTLDANATTNPITFDWRAEMTV